MAAFQDLMARGFHQIQAFFARTDILKSLMFGMHRLILVDFGQTETTSPCILQLLELLTCFANMVRFLLTFATENLPTSASHPILSHMYCRFPISQFTHTVNILTLEVSCPIRLSGCSQSSLPRAPWHSRTYKRPRYWIDSLGNC